MGLGESAGFVHIIDFGLAKMSRPLPAHSHPLPPFLPPSPASLTRDPRRSARPRVLLYVEGTRQYLP